MIKLLYIFIHDYGNIKDQGFNLSSDYVVQFDSVQVNLTIKEQTDKLPHLFHPKIIDVKGIVGENGAGKSTLLHYLSTKAHQHDVGFSEEYFAKDILVFMVDGQLYVNAGKSWSLSPDDIINKTKLNFEHSALSINSSHVSWRDINELLGTKFIFYSNVFDNKPEESFNELLNISTNALSRSDTVTRTNGRIYESSVESHRLLENQRQFELAVAGVRLPFPLPDNFQVRDNELAKHNLSQLLFSKKLNKRVAGRIKRWLELCQKYHWQKNEHSFQSMLDQAFFSQLILNRIVEADRYTQEYFNGYESYTFQLLLEILRNFSSRKGTINLSLLIKKSKALESKIPPGTLQVSEQQSYEIGLGKSAISEMLEDYHKLRQLMEPFFKNPMMTSQGFLVPRGQETVNIYRQYVASKSLLNYLDFFLPRLSSGELGYLTLFSRFYALVSHTHALSVSLEDHERNLVILIDEGDLYFHPQWQTQYLAFLNEFLPQILGDRSIQLILTSHSQFLPSDLPVDHLLFLKRESYDDNGKTAYKAAVVEGPERTFAANIHDLLADTFFMQGAHMGEFAKQQLYILLDILEGKQQRGNWTLSQIKRLIAEVGEPWMRSRLEEKFSLYLNEQQ
ncbi:hypothetical protein [Mucilaginibacter sp. UR6-11]|uniref:hypothetical protein n=1 Tax=Mucilaginibacter sp. UR6-11 TaxID=1435644 RepID=UPI001E3FE546|nr:hypothetical protein [Mucilaginibacter sp. UR6-11]MCC8423585.1 hypothetical protein [Mucilaginibacter sp. UR6-11]